MLDTLYQPLETPLAAGRPVFLKDQCRWPEAVLPEEEFEGVLTVRNVGDGRNVFLGIRYRNWDYFIYVHGGRWMSFAANETRAFVHRGTMGGFLAESIPRGRTIELTFLTGYFVSTAHYVSDLFTVRTRMEPVVPEEEPVISPVMWAVIAGGLLVAGAGIYLVTRTDIPERLLRRRDE